MDDFRTIEGQLSSLGRSDAGKQGGSRDLARIGSEDAVDLLPDLQLLGLDTNCNQRSAEIGVTTSNGVQKATRNVAKETSDDWNPVAASLDLSSQRSSQVGVELLVQALLRCSEGDDVGQIDKLGRRATVVEQRGHVAAAELLTLGDDLVLDAIGDFLEVLGRLQDLGQALAFGIDFLGEGCKDIGALDGILRSLNVVGTDCLDNVIIAAMALLLGSASGTEEAVGGAFSLVLGAASRTDDSGAVDLVAGPGESC